MTALKKELAQVWTPDYIVREMLDEIGYVSSNDSILSQKIMEPSFGAGAFLLEIVNRLVECAKINELSDKEIEQLLEENIYGIDYDTDVYTSTVNDVKNWLASTYSLHPSLKNLYNMDTLDYKMFDEFDYVVGNPPYIRIHDMPADMRRKVKEYAHSTGNSDLYVIFFEIGMSMLKKDGKLAYITPNSWLRNSSQKSFRKNLVQDRQVVKIVNFNAEQVFDKVGTYTCISYLSKSSVDEIVYTDASKDLHPNYTRVVAYDEFDVLSNNGKGDNTLAFSSNDDQIFLDEIFQKDTAALGDVCQIQNGVLTLGNNFFLVDQSVEEYSDLSVNDLIYPAVKATTYKGDGKFQKMIFPYQKNSESGKFEGLSENELRAYTQAFDMLNKNKEKLEQRSLEKDSLWFWYRRQSLQETDKRKLVLSSIIGPQQEKVRAYIVPENTVVYSGFFITEQDSNDLFSNSLSLEDVQRIIESPEFIKYVRIVGKDKNGGYKEFSTTMMKKFRI